jgi:hypothetical protein
MLFMARGVYLLTAQYELYVAWGRGTLKFYLKNIVFQLTFYLKSMIYQP